MTDFKLCPKKAWGTEPWTRAGGDTICQCGKVYWQHPVEKGPGYGHCGDLELTLRRLCDDRLVKL